MDHRLAHDFTHICRSFHVYHLLESRGVKLPARPSKRDLQKRIVRLLGVFTPSVIDILFHSANPVTTGWNQQVHISSSVPLDAT